MNKMIIVITILGGILSGCSSFNVGGEKLVQQEYENLVYVAKISNVYVKVNEIEIIKKVKDRFYSIESVLPIIKQEVFELNKNKNLVISNVKITSFDRKRIKYYTYSSCSGGQATSAHTNFEQPRKCSRSRKSTTKFVPYLKITADIFSLPETITL